MVSGKSLIIYLLVHECPVTLLLCLSRLFFSGSVTVDMLLNLVTSRLDWFLKDVTRFEFLNFSRVSLKLVYVCLTTPSGLVTVVREIMEAAVRL